MDTNTTSWAPIGETSYDVLNDSVNLIASTVICGVSYGVVLTLYLISTYFLILQYRDGKHKKQAIYSFIYISWMFFFGTVYVASNARTTQLAYVNDKNFPGGSSLYAQYIFHIPINIVGVVAFFAINWMTDALLIWRLKILYQSMRFANSILILPIFMWFASFAMSIVTIFQSCRPNQSFWSTVAVKFALAYYSITVAFTIITTLLMILCISIVRRQYTQAIGYDGHTSEYIGIAAMLVESSALYTIWAIVFLGLYIVNHPVQYVFLDSLAEMEIVAPLLIIFRVSQGKAWGPTTATNLTSAELNVSSSRTTGIKSASSSSTGTLAFSKATEFVSKVDKA